MRIKIPSQYWKFITVSILLISIIIGSQPFSNNKNPNNPKMIALPYDFSDLESRNYEFNLPTWNFLKWSSDGEFLAVVSHKGDVYILDSNYNFSKIIEYPGNTDKLLVNVGIQWILDSHELIIRYHDLNKVEFWDIETEKLLYYFKVNFPIHIEINPEGYILAVHYRFGASHIILFNTRNQTTIDTLDYNLVILKFAWKQNSSSIMLINQFANLFNFDLNDKKFTFVEDELDYWSLNSNHKLEYITLQGENFVKIASTINHEVFFTLTSNITFLGTSGINYQISPMFYRSFSTAWSYEGNYLAISLSYHRLGYGQISIWKVPEMTLSHNITSQPLYQIDWLNSKGKLAGVNKDFVFIWLIEDELSILSSSQGKYYIFILVVVVTILIIRRIRRRSNL